MPISRKPKQASSSVDVEALISRGGSVAVGEQVEAPSSPGRPTATVNLRIPAPIIERLDRALETLPLKKPRHAWLLEAILEKLEREESE